MMSKLFKTLVATSIAFVPIQTKEQLDSSARQSDQRLQTMEKSLSQWQNQLEDMELRLSRFSQQQDARAAGASDEDEAAATSW